MNTKLFTAAAAICALAALSCSKMTKPDQAGFSGRDMTGSFEILREGQSKAALLEAREDTEWELYAGPSVEDIDLSKPLARGDGAGAFPLGVPDDKRSYFQLTTPDGNAILAERRLPLEGGYNFRDLGGIRTTDGRYVRWGKLFRSDDMQNLTPADLAYLSSIPLRSVVDFRSTQEIQAAPDKLPDSVKTHYLYSISPGNLMGMVAEGKLPSARELAKMMEKMNEQLVCDKDAVDQYRKFFALLQDEQNLPLSFHCTAGKDRTGMAAALFLSSLGVDEHIILNDYLASNHYLEDKYSALLGEYPGLEPLMEVRAEYLQAGLDKIAEEYGSIEQFLTGPLGVDIEKMKEIYLY